MVKREARPQIDRKLLPFEAELLQPAPELVGPADFLLGTNG